MNQPINIEYHQQNHLERVVISVEVDAAVSGVVEPLVETLEVLERQVRDSGGVAARVDAVRVVREDRLQKGHKKTAPQQVSSHQTSFACTYVQNLKTYVCPVQIHVN